MNKTRFDKTHRIRSQPLGKGVWVIVLDSSQNGVKTCSEKFKPKWFGPYIVAESHDNGSYSLTELDGTFIKSKFAGKRIKLFKKRDEAINLEDIASTMEKDDKLEQNGVCSDFGGVDVGDILEYPEKTTL
jgi:hypothetical protein